MPRLYPNIHLLRAFIHVAQHLSISRAAEELHLTQSAVSKQIIDLESYLGVMLFERVRKRLVLSPAGQRYAANIAPVLLALETASLEIIAFGNEGGEFKLSCLPTFAAKWLIPRLADFQKLHPKISVNFVPFAEGRDFGNPSLDCAIRYGQGIWPGAQSVYLTGREMVLIAPPELARSLALRKPQDIARHALLQHTSVPRAWQHWCEAQRVRDVNPLVGPKLDQYHSLIRAVMAGLGLALVPRCLVQDDIDAGLVQAPMLPSLEWDFGYYLCFPDAKAHVPTVSAFREWLLAECA